MAFNIASPYGPRARRSQRFVLLWLAAFLLVGFMTYYLATRHRDASSTYAKMIIHGEHVDVGRSSPKMEVID
ncbi:hypothetical protein JX265_005008 [Neoarthrinium moseri]|uniref:Uncharacterized protein n=1 Tax=Neoarthrinium moseri TaxID=1658444 RepID=A0A9Q0ARI9_9PEZI|nr:uncharacterized protein JN550_009268 [Neoarthrinium moseri]KAI1846468.1 hypothetical protein JX266_007365 [Neoarthrinium moseri]KAI1863989.1 hypothetical protein JN550_009268 [Neoarthrinium moseri]KAI1873386.1 hypothetical protein JX265_005008 [Neoarthrinium moseri]